MNSAMKAIFIVVAVISCSACSYVFGRSVEVKVVDDANKPIENARVKMVFRKTYESDIFTKKTSPSGKVSIRGVDHHGTNILVRKHGYYPTQEMESSEKSVSVNMLLRKIKNPIPMYVKEVALFLPKKDKTYGYDLVKGDLVQPHGNGVTAHVFLTLKGKRTSAHDDKSRLLVEFADPRGGVKTVESTKPDSNLAFPYQAPGEGYKNDLDLYRNRDEEGVETNVDRKKLGYFLKVVGSQKMKNEPLTARYGKIRGYIRFAVGENKEENSEGYVGFTYYLNPNPNDRNIEFDPQRNLFKNAEKTYPP